ncbi:hypothetical protein [Streptomyces anulatus]|uniref:hypothetical protein n=1 Tax=Streptomyces anulatus TaxID=1892 RepID=UPI0036D8F26C
MGQRPYGEVVGDISHGTVWVAARQLAPGAPAQEWVGLRVTGGTIEVKGDVQFRPGQLVVADDARIALTLDLESAPPSGTAEDGAGAEAVATACRLPRTATLRINPDGPGAVGDLDASLSVFGQEIALSRRSGAAGPPACSLVGRRVLVPLAATPDRLTVAKSRSTLFAPSGTAAIRKAHWSLPVTTDPIDLLGEAAGCGRVALDLAPGLRASWYGLEGGPVSLGRADLYADGAALRITAVPAQGRRAHQAFRLWKETTRDRSRVEVTFPGPFSLSYVSHASGTDEFTTHGLARPWLDRPRTAAGRRVDTALRVTFRLTHEAGGVRLALESKASCGGAGEQHSSMALALSNALLTVTPPRGLRLDGPLAGPGRIDSGELSLTFLLRHLLPTLPDPYAANFPAPTTRPAHADTPEVRARVLWSTPSEAALSLGVVHDGTDDDLPAELVPAPEVLPLETEAERILLTSFEEWLGGHHRRSGLALLDVSSFADQLGVAIALTAGQRRVPLTVDDLALRTEAENTLVFLLPQFQWEPVRNLANPLTGDQEDVLTFDSDGGPTLMGTRSVTLVPFTPVPVAQELVRAHEEDDAPAAVLFTLPFGMRAWVWLDPGDRAFKEPATLRMLRARFPGLTGVRRLSLRAGVPEGAEPAGSAGSPPPPLLTGRAWQARTFDGTGSPNPALHSVLGPLRDDFNSTFNHTVPLSRIDFGGHGASLVSRWVNNSQEGIHISQVTFDAFHGRTAFERIQLTTLLVPCFAVLVRTITLERYGSGAVVRWDSGWTATTPGLFRHPTAGRIGHPGAVRGLFNIREIHDTDRYAELAADGAAPAARMQAVYFDADVDISGVQDGQGTDGRVPAHGHVGFVQRIPLGQPVSTTGVGALTPGQLRELFDSQGPLGGPVDCTVRIGSSPHTMGVHGVYAARAGVNPGTGDEEFAVALYGSPHLPGAGQWSVVRVDNATGRVEPVGAGPGVPLVRRNNAVPHSPNKYPLRWAEPRHLFDSSPDMDFALLFAGESQRILYSRPRVTYEDTNITSALAPWLADPYTMLRSGGLFPSLDEAFALDQPYPLSVASGRLAFVPDTVSVAPGPQNQRLVEAAAWNAEARYEDAEFTIDTADDWRIGASKVCQRLVFGPLQEILVFVHDIASPAAGGTGFPQPEVRPGASIAPVAEVLDLLRKLVPGTDMAGGRAEPGLPGPLHVTSSFTGTAYRLTAVADFMLQGEQGEGVDCGIGKVRGGLKLGADLVADPRAGDIRGSVFLEITGSYQQLIFPAIYAGGEIRFRIRGDASGTAEVELDACAVGSVGGDLIPGLVELEATVKYGYFIGIGDAFRPGIVLGMSGRALLLSGLLGFSLSVEGRLIVERLALPSSPVKLRGDILVAGTVTLAWAVKKRKSFHTTYDVELDWETLLFAAKAGILPAP